MKPCYDYCILGASAYAAGFLKGHPAYSCAVLDAGCTCASEFAMTLYDDGTAASYMPETDAGRALKQEFLDRQALDENGVWLPAVSPLLAKAFSESGADCYFMSAVSEITREGDGYLVRFCSYGAEHTFHARYILDTTARFVSHAFFGADIPHFRRVSLSYVTDAGDGIPVFRKFSSGTGISKDADAAEWRTELLSSRDSAEGQLVWIAPELYYEPDVTPNGGYCPSSSYGSFLRAYDAGAAAVPPTVQPDTVCPPVLEAGDYDVIVVGLGTAGAVAAVTAGGEGLRVLGLENLSVLGGSATAGGVLGYYYGFKGGLYRQIDEEANALPGFVRTGTVGAVQKDLLLSRYAKARNVDCRLNAYFCKTERENDTVTGVFWTEYGVMHHARARFVIDCTAEAAAAVSSGAEMIGGRASDGDFQPYSSVAFTYRNRYFGYGYIDNGTVDPYDPDDFGKAVLSSSSCYLHVRDSYADHTYFGIAPLIGLREGRKIKGEETVAFPALLDEGYTDKPVYFGNSNLDNHGKDSVLEDRAYQDWITICGLWGWGMSIPVPAGALIPKGLRGLLCAGRCVSVDHDIAMGLRMKDDCSKSGEAAALLAVLAIRNGTDAKDVPYEALKPLLVRTGCLKDSDRMRLEKQQFNLFFDEPLWCTDWEALETGLSGNEPGYYLWSCRYSDHTEELLGLLSSENPDARIHAAFALALTGHGEPQVVSALLRAVEKKDAVIPDTGRKYITMRAVSAISALGRLGALEAVPLLLSVVRDPDGFTSGIPFTPYVFMTDREDVSFQFASTAVGALCEIARVHPERKDALRAALTEATAGKQYLVSMMGTVGFKKDVTASIKKLIAAI